MHKKIVSNSIVSYQRFIVCWYHCFRTSNQFFDFFYMQQISNIACFLRTPKFLRQSLHFFHFEILNWRLLIMPLPLGHSAIGFATHSLISHNGGSFNKWKVAIFIVILSNLPDIDVLFGLILQNNGNALHRGPTHSILFALIIGFLASKSSKLWRHIPKISFKTGFMLVLSHVVADYFFTNSPVSFYWPFEVRWSTGNSGWSSVLHTVFFEAAQDSSILLICTGIVVLVMIFRRFHFLRKTKLLPYSTNEHLQSR